MEYSTGSGSESYGGLIVNMDMSLNKTTEDICSCCCCGKKNYISKYFAPAEGEPEGIYDLYDLHFGIQLVRLCRDCLDHLAIEIEALV